MRPCACQLGLACESNAAHKLPSNRFVLLSAHPIPAELGTATIEPFAFTGGASPSTSSLFVSFAANRLKTEGVCAPTAYPEGVVQSEHFSHNLRTVPLYLNGEFCLCSHNILHSGCLRFPVSVSSQGNCAASAIIFMLFPRSYVYW